MQPLLSTRQLSASRHPSNHPFHFAPPRPCVNALRCQSLSNQANLIHFEAVNRRCLGSLRTASRASRVAEGRTPDRLQSVEGSVDTNASQVLIPSRRYPRIERSDEKSQSKRMCEEKAREIVDCLRSETLSDEQITKVPSYVLVNSLKMLVKSKELEMGRQLFDKVVANRKTDDHQMAVLLRATHKLQGFESGKLLLHYWLDEGYPVGCGTADVGVRKAVDNRDLNSASALLEKLQKKRVHLRSFAYNIILQGAALEKKMDVTVKVFQWLRDSSTQPDSFSFRNAVWGIRGPSGKHHLNWIYDELQASDVRLDTNIYFAFMISAVKCQNLEIAKKMFKDYTSQPIPERHRTARVVNMLLDAYSKCNTMPNVDEIFKTYDDLGLRMDEYSFGLLLNSLYRSAPSLALTRRILIEMSRRNVKMNRITAAAAVICCVESEDDSIEDRFSLGMHITRIAKTQKCYHLLLRLASTSGFESTALRIQKEMEESGFSTNRMTLRVLYEGYRKANFLNIANKYFKMLHQFKG